MYWNRDCQIVVCIHKSVDLATVRVGGCAANGAYRLTKKHLIHTNLTTSYQNSN